jgi:hypothetical protein
LLPEGSNLNPSLSLSPDHGAIDVVLLRRIVATDHLMAQGLKITDDSRLAHMLDDDEGDADLDDECEAVPEDDSDNDELQDTWQISLIDS